MTPPLFPDYYKICLIVLSGVSLAVGNAVNLGKRAGCNRDNCLGELAGSPTQGTSLCSSYGLTPIQTA